MQKTVLEDERREFESNRNLLREQKLQLQTEKVKFCGKKKSPNLIFRVEFKYLEYPHTHIGRAR